MAHYTHSRIIAVVSEEMSDLCNPRKTYFPKVQLYYTEDKISEVTHGFFAHYKRQSMSFFFNPRPKQACRCNPPTTFLDLLLHPKVFHWKVEKVAIKPASLVVGPDVPFTPAAKIGEPEPATSKWSLPIHLLHF
jgi:hypothetical protein